MNFKEQIFQEIKDKNYKDKFLIARLLYIRTGQFFEYHPYYRILSSEAKDVENKKTVEHYITKTTEKYIICSTWARIYSYFLNCFNIENTIEDNGLHAFVFLKVNNIWILADMTAECEDISRIKFGFSTSEYICEDDEPQDFKKEIRKVDRQIHYCSKKYVDEWLLEKKEKLVQKTLQEKFYLLGQMINGKKNVGTLSASIIIEKTFSMINDKRFLELVKKKCLIEKGKRIVFYQFQEDNQYHNYVLQSFNENTRLENMTDSNFSKLLGSKYLK